ncbi:glycogen synthase GlgA [Coraliomargarita sp. SDUM461004]|uniref:Glycogen synthase n=1 Tax=Thalassobacterium sedimentorum TaxID=3041258 RepID=A0ABU1AND6_9BACT|nr:glycogen synthase GlgA [Coraliomargarita sp. SDUM461004]MDQ8196222.1 glycogen synthase GlgA [Coraliomargarita sp. SDUM461004]
MAKQRILMLAPEVAPFKKVGGLADVVSALSKSLVALGHDVRILMPRYTEMQAFEGAQALERPLIVRLGGHEAYGRIWQHCLPGTEVPCYFIEHNQYFGAASVYVGPSGNEDDNGQRFTFLSRAAIDFCEQMDWIPDVVHAHDWPCALTSVYMNTTEARRPMGRAASVFTIHNLEHHGWFHRSLLQFSGLPESVFRSDGLESMGELNMLKGGLYHATKITTVSPTYAREIQTPDGGCGLNALLRFRSPDLIGVLNGVDLDEWNPQTDPYIGTHFSAQDLSGKAAVKARLQQAYGLEVNPQRPLFTVVSRLVNQKGLDLLAACCERLMSEMQIQIAVLGTGEPNLEYRFNELSARYPGRLGAYIGFNNELAHLTIAGADCFLMPSRFEPCGLGQMYAMRYGAVPVVRATGGLIDTVAPFVEGAGVGTGFVFQQASADALYYTIGWACATYYDRPEEFKQLQQNGMAGDYSWNASAKKYESIYNWAITSRQAAFV